MPTNVNDLSIDTRKKIRDKAVSAGLTADQVKAQLDKTGITETNPVKPVADTSANTNPNLATDSPVNKGGVDPNVGIPTVNTPPYKDTGANGVTETTNTPNTTDTSTSNIPEDKVSQTLIDQQKILEEQKAGLTETNKQATIDNQKKDNEAYLKQLEDFKIQALKSAEEAKIQKDQLEKEALTRKQDLLNKANADLKKNLDATTKDLEAQKAVQAQADANKAIAFQAEVEANRLKTASWAGRLGLNFSTGGISYFESVANNAQLALQTIKTEAVQNQTSLDKQIADYTLQYESAVNSNIDKYLDIVDKYKEDAITRIDNLNQDKLKTSEEILTEKKRIADEFRLFQKTTEDDFKAEQRQLANDLITNAQNIKIQSDNIKNEFLSDLTTRFETGELSQLTPAEIADYEKKYNLPTGFISLKRDQGIKTAIRTELDNIAGSNYIPENLSDLINQVNDDMSSGYTLEEAVQNRISLLSQNDKNLQEAINRKINTLSKEELDVLKFQETNRLDWAKFTADTNYKEATLNLDAQKASVDQAYKSGLLSNSAYNNQISAISKAGELAKIQDDYGIDMSGAINSLLSGPNGGATSQSTGGITLDMSGSGMRTDRNNNPTAMTTDVARTAGLVEGVDYIQGDPFKTASGTTLYTAKLLGDPIQTTIKAIDNAGFTTQSGATRWNYTDKLGLNNQVWAGYTPEQKAEAVIQMYKQEGGKGKIINNPVATTQSAEQSTSTPTETNNTSTISNGVLSVEEFANIPAKNKQRDIIGALDPTLRVTANGTSDRGVLANLYQQALENKAIKDNKEEEQARLTLKKQALSGDSKAVDALITRYNSEDTYRNGLQEAFNLNRRLGKDLSTEEAGISFENLQNTLSNIEEDLTSGLAKTTNKDGQEVVTNNQSIEKLKTTLLNKLLKPYNLYYKDGKYKLNIPGGLDLDIFNPEANKGLWDRLFGINQRSSVGGKISEKLYKK